LLGVFSVRIAKLLILILTIRTFEDKTFDIKYKKIRVEIYTIPNSHKKLEILYFYFGKLY